MRKTIRRGIFVTATAACALGFGLFQASAATLPTVPELPLSGLGALTNVGQGLDGVSEFADLPTEGLVPTDGLPTDELGTPGELPVGLDQSALPQLPKLPTQTNQILDSPVVDVPQTDRLPLVAQVDHNGIAQKLIPNTDGVNVQGLPTPEVPNLTSTPDAVKLPATAPQTPGMQSVGLPQALPVVSAVELPEAPSIHDVTGDVDLPAELPTLPTV